jgi:hypothetical protein
VAVLGKIAPLFFPLISNRDSRKIDYLGQLFEASITQGSEKSAMKSQHK